MLPPDVPFDRRKNQLPDTGAQSRSYYDAHYKAELMEVYPGECILTDKPDEMLVTLLGSCVSACIRDTQLGIGGMNHFMMPGSPAKNTQEMDLRYGQPAMKHLLDSLFARGAVRERLEIRLYGGASLIKSSLAMGETNIAFVRNYLREQNLSVHSEDLGGLYPRRVHFVPKTGKIYRLLMRRSSDTGVFNREQELQDKVRDNLSPSPLK